MGKIKLKLIAEHIDYQIHFTHHRHHATELPPGFTPSGDPVTIVVLGGDGSVDEVICDLQNLKPGFTLSLHSDRLWQ